MQKEKNLKVYRIGIEMKKMLKGYEEKKLRVATCKSQSGDSIAAKQTYLDPIISTHQKQNS